MDSAGFNLTDVGMYIAELERVWTEHNINKQSKEDLFHLLDTYFERSSNPFAALLNLAQGLIFSSGSHHDKILDETWREFSRWSQKIDSKQKLEYLHEEVLRRAAQLACDGKAKQISPICSIFSFDQHSNDEVLKIFSRLLIEEIANNNYRGASIVIRCLGSATLPLGDLLSDESIRQLSLFLCSKKEGSLLRRILAELKPTDRLFRTIGFLDSMLVNETLMEPSESSLGQCAEKPETGHSSLYTMLSAIVKALSIPSHVCPNIMFIAMKERSELMISATFSPQGVAEMDFKTFYELVLNFSQIDARYHPFIVALLLKRGLPEISQIIAKELGASTIDVDTLVNETISRLPSSKSMLTVFSEVDYYRLRLPDSSIVFVNQVETLELALNYIFSPFESKRLVGYDSEWPAITKPGHPNNVSIVQIALHDRVFIIDMENIAPEMSGNMWQLFQRLFIDANVTLVSFGFDSDSSALVESFPDIFKDAKPRNIVDLETWVSELWRRLQNSTSDLSGVSNLSIDAKNSPTPASLTEVAQVFLKRRINKMYRLSNWSRRPLDPPQLMYAAIDAYCLLEIYDAVKNVSDTLNMLEGGHSVESNPEEIPLLIHPTLMEIGYLLKHKGFDVIVHTEFDHVEDLIGRAKSDGRKAVLPSYLVPKLPEPGVTIIATPPAIIKDQIDALSVKLRKTITFIEDPVINMQNPIQKLHQIAAHLPNRASIHYEDLYNSNRDEPPFVSQCQLFVVSSGELFKESRGMGTSKHDAKCRAAVNMIITLQHVI